MPSPGRGAGAEPDAAGPAFIFSGFGSHHRKMAKQLYLEDPVFKHYFDEVNALIIDESGNDYADMISYLMKHHYASQTRYTTNTRSGSVSAIDLRDNSAVKISEGEGAHLRQVLVDEDSNTVYASVFGAKEKPSAVWIIDSVKPLIP